MEKWEYNIFVLREGGDEDKSMIEQLNDLGNEGWELFEIKYDSGAALISLQWHSVLMKRKLCE